MTLEAIFNRYSFMIAFIVGSMMFCWRLPKRKYFWIKLIAGIITHIVFVTLWTNVINNSNGGLNLFFSCASYLIQYLILLTTVYFCYDCNIIATVFCVTSGYCVQHISQRINRMILELTGTIALVWIHIILYVVSIIVIYFIVYYLFKKLNGKTNIGISIDSPIQLIIMTLALCVMIVVEQAMIPYVFAIEDLFTRIGNFVSSIIFATVVLMLEFNLLSRKDAESERDTLKQLMLQEREQFYIEKTVIDMINIKSHDLKHQLAGLNGRIDADELSKMQTAVDVYDSVFKTGNNALDVVLTMKSLICENKEIELTCMANGEKMSFMSDSDIYSLFGNIMDNAIEAVDKLHDKDRRVISITVMFKHGFVFIHSENYYEGPVKILDGLPQTTKNDRVNHGYGLLSIRTLTQKYGGEFKMKTSSSEFFLDIVFPLKEKDK